VIKQEKENQKLKGKEKYLRQDDLKDQKEKYKIPLNLLTKFSLNQINEKKMTKLTPNCQGQRVITK
jgi:hypothetical protein